jgi:hypothetical protein
MKRLLLVPLIAVALALGACSGKSVFQGGYSITAPVTNPVTREQQAAIEGSYGIAANLILTYGRLPRCKSGEAFTLVNRCSTGPLVRKLKQGNRVAFKQLQNLRTFMDTNQTVNAISAYNALRATLADLQATATANGLGSVAAPR